MTNEYEFLKIITAQLCTSQYMWISQFMLSCIYICGNYLEITLLILGLLLSCCKFRSFPCSVIVDNVRSAMYFINYFLLWSQVISQIFSLKQLLLGPTTPFFSSVTHVILLDSEYRIPSLFNNSKIVIFSNTLLLSAIVSALQKYRESPGNSSYLPPLYSLPPFCVLAYYTKRKNPLCP